MAANEFLPVARRLVARAVLAPSSHNTQPWLFRVRSGAIDLVADRKRALPVNDPDNRELTISCGCALMNLRVAAAALGRHVGVGVETLPRSAGEDVVARIGFDGAASGHGGEARLDKCIERRRTYRKRFTQRAVALEVIESLEHAAMAEHARLRVLSDDASRAEAARLVAEGDAVQWANPGWRRELAAWMRPRSRGEGLAVPPLVGPVARLVVRAFDMGGGVGAKDRDLAANSPLLAVIMTDGDDSRAWLQAGQALQRVLLTACRHGLQASYLNQPIQVASLRHRVGKIAGRGYPQILLRLGYPEEEVSAAPRRPVEAVLLD